MAKMVYEVPLISRAVRTVFVVAESAKQARDLVTEGAAGESIGVEYYDVHPGRIRRRPGEPVEKWE